MQVCPLCDAKFPQEATFCWFDGSKLIEPGDSESKQDSAQQAHAASENDSSPNNPGIASVEDDPEVLKAQEEANAARLAAEQALQAAQQADRLAKEAAQKARERAEQRAAAAKAALEEARAQAQERLEEANRVEQERLKIEADIEAAKAAELQAKQEAEAAELAKQAEEEAAAQAKERAEAAEKAAAAAKAAEEQALAAAKAAAEMAREAAETARTIQEEAKLAQEAKEAAKQLEEAAREKVANECQTTQVLQQAALEKAIAEREAREEAQRVLQAVEQGNLTDTIGSKTMESTTTNHPEAEEEAAAKAEEEAAVKAEEEAAAKAEEEAAAKAEEVKSEVPTPTAPIYLSANQWEGQTLRQYNILKHLGTGSQGDVFLAKHNNTGARVALKILNDKTCEEPKRVALFFEQLEKASSLQHPGLITIHETIHELDAPSFYTMDALNGAPLSSYRPQQIDICLEIASQLAKAIAKAHENKILHGQLNMENVYLLANAQGKRRVSVLDFGAYALHSDTSELTVHDDMRSLGQILEQLFSHFEEQPEELARVIEVCLNSEGQEKPKTADDIAKTLQWISRQRPVTKKLEPTSEPSHDEPLLGDSDDDDDDDFEIMQWKKKSAARKRTFIFSALTMGLAVAAIAYGTQQRWDEAIDNLSTSLSPAKTEEKTSKDKPQAKSEPASVKANKKTRVETSSLKPQQTRAVSQLKAKPAKTVKAKPTPAKKVAPVQAVAPAPKPVAMPAPQAIKPPSPPPAPVRVEFQSNPVGARVRRVADKKVIGVTPFALQIPSDSKSESYEFSLPGYESVSQEWNPNKSGRVLATLKVQSKPVPAPAKPKVSVQPSQKEEAKDTTHEDLVDPFAQ